VLWHCWLGVRKSIQAVKNWVMRCWHGYLSLARCKWFAYGPAYATATPLSLASLKSRMVWPFWCWLTQVVLEKRPLNGSLSVLLMPMGYWCQRAGVQGIMLLPPGVRWWMKKGWGQATGCGQCSEFPSVLWHCWLGDRKGTRPTKRCDTYSQRFHCRTNAGWVPRGDQLTKFTWKMVGK